MTRPATRNFNDATRDPFARPVLRRPVKPLLSVEEAAILLGESRSSVYRSIDRGDLPLPVFRINGRLRIPRRAVERLIDGELPLVAMEGLVKAGEAGESALDEPVVT